LRAEKYPRSEGGSQSTPVSRPAMRRRFSSGCIHASFDQYGTSMSVSECILNFLWKQRINGLMCGVAIAICPSD
jgi:hypothetical protein